MQARPQTSTGNALLNEVKNLPCETTPNYKMATAATAVFAFDTLLSMGNCGSISFYFNAFAALLSGSIAYNQYNEGAPLKKAKAMYNGIFGKPTPAVTAVAAEPEVKAPTLA